MHKALPNVTADRMRIFLNNRYEVVELARRRDKLPDISAPARNSQRDPYFGLTE